MSEPSAPPAPRPFSAARLRRGALIVLGLAVLLAIWGILSRLSARMALERAAARAAIVTVATVKPSRGPASDSLALPGSVQAYYEAAIYARTAGYLRTWYTDIGAPVKKGQVLAEIDTPELDQDLHRAQADLATAEANYELARTTNERWQGLLASHTVSQQDADQRAGDAAAKASARQAAVANLARLKELESFKRILAPFEGVVTVRNTDVGALINAGQNPGSALFRVADTHRLRIYVSVPQAYADAIHPGLEAELAFTEHPERRYRAAVTSTARALDANSRTLQVELQIDNAAGELLPGSYAQVYFNLPGSASALRVPANTILFRAAGLQVATLGPTGRVHLKSIQQGRDFGTEIEVLSGLSPSDTLVLNPPDSISEGAEVRLVPSP
jgi:RND family efflux transporter MFP subunit